MEGLVLLLVLRFISILEWWILKMVYFNGMGNNFITFILHSLKERCWHWFDINWIKLLHIILCILNAFKVWHATYISLYFSNANSVRAITRWNFSLILQLILIDTLNNISIWIMLHILITNIRYYVCFNSGDFIS